MTFKITILNVDLCHCSLLGRALILLLAASYVNQRKKHVPPPLPPQKKIGPAPNMPPRHF